MFIYEILNRNAYFFIFSKSYEIRFAIKLDNGSKYYAYYEDFLLTGSDYSLIYSNTRTLDNKLHDCLAPLNGSAFSAHDHDVDGSDVRNCGGDYNGGWWFNGDSCALCNPLGPIHSPFTGTRLQVDNELFWSGFDNLIPFTLQIFFL